MLKGVTARTGWVHKESRPGFLKYLKFAAAVLVLVAVPIIAANAKSDSLTCQVKYRNDTTLRIGGHIIKAEVSATPAELSKGLSGRQCIGSQQGMLFEFPASGYYPFWMKDMRFPIDIIWISANKKVVKVQKDLQPSSYPRTFSSAEPAQYILELKAGEAAQLGLANGTIVYF